MTKKDIALFKKLVSNPEETPVTKSVSCYVDVSRDMVAYQKPATFLNIEDRQRELFCAFIKKGVTGKIGSTAIELLPEENLLERLRDCELNEDSVRKAVDAIRSNYHTDENYCIYFLYGAYDVPDKERDSEEVYRFVLVLIQPCPLSKPAIMYDAPGNTFTGRRSDRILDAPLHTFLWPALDEGHTDIDHAVYYAKTEKMVAKSGALIPALFGTNIPLTPSEQKSGFQKMLETAFNNEVPYDAVKGIYDCLAEKCIDMSLSGEDMRLKPNELADIIIEQGNIPETDQEAAKEAAKEFAGRDFSVSNIVPQKVTIETESANIKSELSEMFTIERRMIDGKDYYLIPARHSSVDGLLLAGLE